MRATRHMVIGAAVASLALVTAGCSSSGGGTSGSGAEGTYQAPSTDTTATLSIANWGNPGDQKIYEAAIARFNQKYPKVTVKDNFSQVVNWGDYINKVQASIASGDAPDIINIATEGVEYGLAKNLYLPLDNYIKQDTSVQGLINDVSPALDQGLLQGRQDLPAAQQLEHDARLLQPGAVREGGNPPPSWISRERK